MDESCKYYFATIEDDYNTILLKVGLHVRAKNLSSKFDADLVSTAITALIDLLL